MSHEQLKAEMLETRKEIERLKKWAPTSTTPTVHRDLSLISVISKWPGSDDTLTLEEFLESIKSSGRIGRWTENDQQEVAVLKLTISAKLYYRCCDELHEQGAHWQLFKEVFRQWYRDVHMEQYHFTKLQTARRKKRKSSTICRSLYEFSAKDDDKIRRPSDSAHS